MADLISLTMKMASSQFDAICKRAGELDVSRSELLRQGSLFWLAVLSECPGLVNYDEERLARLAGKVGKIIAILENYQGNTRDCGSMEGNG